jgi:DNA anti-recombination protein RmuC
MPVTARLSKLFYERLGEQVANELVDWFNQVDATYRADLRELNELNFARFDAKLEQRVAELHARLDAKFDRVATELDAKIDRVAAELHAKFDRVAAELNARMDAMVADLHAVLERRLAEQTRWLFVAWASLLIPIMGLWVRG